MFKLKQILIFCCLFSNLSAQEIPDYYELLKSEDPNIHQIHEAYNAYYQDHEWEKDQYFRAYREFIRAYKLSDFDEAGNPIKPSFNQHKSAGSAAAVGGEWTSMPVKIDRNDCYYTGQNGVLSAIDVEVNNPNVVYAGTLAGELFKSSDKGLTWSETLINNLPEIGNVNNIKIAHSDSSIIYAATDAGLIKSADGGNTFDMTTIDYRSSFPNINYGGDDYRSEYMYVDVANDDSDKVVTTDINPSNLNTFVAVSQDGGQNWNKYAFGYKNFPVDVKFHPTNSNIIYTLILESSTKKFSFYKSTDSGLSFQQITNGFPVNNNPNQQENRTRIALSQAQPNLVALYFNVNNEGTGFYKSTDSGDSFSKVCCGNTTDIVNNASGNRDFFGEGMNGVQIRWATKFAISDTDSNFVVAATNRAPRLSFNQMQDWFWTPQQINVSNQPYNVMSSTCGTQMHGDLKDIIIRGDDIWIANDGGLALSEDKGQTFTERADGIPVTMALGFDMTQDRRDVIVAAMDHNGIIVRDQSIYGENWKPLGGGDASNASINPIDNLWLYGRPSGDVLFRRPETGPSHSHPSYTGLNVNLGSGYFSRFNNVQFHPNNYYTLYIVDYQNFKIKKSTDNGINWQDILDIQSGNNWSYAEVKVSHSNPDVLYVSDYSNWNSTLSRSANGGQTWNNILPNNIPSGYRVRNIEIDSEDPNVAWLTLNNNYNPIVYKTTDGGATWTDYSAGLDGYKIYSIIHQKGASQGVYVGTRSGVYYIDNTLSSWVKYGTDMDGRNISFLKINYAYNIIRAGTIAGIWENDLYQTNAPQANISMDNNEIDCGEIINFADHSAASVNATYSWSFPGGVPTSSTDERPQVIYPDPGSYSATLTVTDENGTDTYTYNDITVNATACTDFYLCNSVQLIGVSGISESSYYNNERIAQTLDGDPNTHWHNNWPTNAPMPHTLDYDLGETYSINGFRLLNRPDNSNGWTKDIELYGSTDNSNWTLLTSESLPSTSVWQTILFPTATARYFRIKILSNQDGNNVSALAEIEIIGHSDSDGDNVCDFQDDCPLEYGDMADSGCPTCIIFDMKVLLEGGYDTTSNEMTTTLNTERGLLPGQTPSNILATPTSAGQPYSTIPWSYNGGEGSDWTDVNYSADVVDWILVSFRTDIDKNTEVGQAAALLNKSGAIDFPTCALLNQGIDSVYVIIEHRNHIGIMSPQKVAILNGTLNFDFRTTDSYRDSTSSGQKQLPNGIWCMFAGDIDQSDFPSYDINGTDKAVWLPENGLFYQYSKADTDMNGDVNGGDKALWDKNNGVSSRVPK